jgi:hypothetical protein
MLPRCSETVSTSTSNSVAISVGLVLVTHLDALTAALRGEDQEFRRRVTDQLRAGFSTVPAFRLVQFVFIRGSSPSRFLHVEHEALEGLFGEQDYLARIVERRVAIDGDGGILRISGVDAQRAGDERLQLETIPSYQRPK